ncbi:MAG: glycosyltransferase [Pyrinomonadaceae bacterium]
MNSVEPIKKIKLSVVIASQNAVTSAGNCLSEIKKQSREDTALEIIVVDNSTDHTGQIIADNFPDIKIIKAPKEKLIPELWQIGIEAGSGDIVALTTIHFVPADNWIKEIIRAHQSPYSGIGGAIENAPEANIISWAIYFCRYSRYMLPFDEKTVDDFAADNASYKRDSLNRVKNSSLQGFWEVFVHQAMKKNNLHLALIPTIIVYHQQSFNFLGFLKQRFSHGRQFGSKRAENISGGKRMALIFLSPLIPFLYIYRITNQVFTKNRNIGKYFLALPVLFVFLISWTLGEFCGYLVGQTEIYAKR